jgi:PAS domain S-box-containing protein
MTPEYENAYTKYRLGFKPLRTPLICWDFYNQYYSDAFLMNNIQKNWKEKINFLKIIKEHKKEVIVTDKNFKIIFATDTIIHMNGYHSKEVIGKSPSFFQGIDTCKKTKNSIKKALLNQEPFKEVILNYKKNGETYWCQIEAFPKFDINGNFVNYVAFERLAS